MKTTETILPIHTVLIRQSDLFEVQTEDYPIAVFNYFLVARVMGREGVEYVHRATFPTRQRVERFLAIVDRAGVIDLAHWDTVDVLDSAEISRQDAAFEAEQRAWEGF